MTWAWVSMPLWRSPRGFFGTDTKPYSRLIVIIACFSPALVYSSAFRPFSMFLFLTIVCITFIQQNRYWLAAAFGVLGSAARPYGALMVFSFLGQTILYTHSLATVVKGKAVRIIVRNVLLSLGFGVGPLMVMIIDWHNTGNALAFLLVQKAWGQSLTVPFLRILRWFVSPYLVGYYGWTLDPLAVAGEAVALLMVIYAWKMRDWSNLGYLLASCFILFGASTFGGSVRWLFEIYYFYFYWAGSLSRMESDYQVIGVALLSMVTMCIVVLYGMGFHSVLS